MGVGWYTFAWMDAKGQLNGTRVYGEDNKFCSFFQTLFLPTSKKAQPLILMRSTSIGTTCIFIR